MFDRMFGVVRDINNDIAAVVAILMRGEKQRALGNVISHQFYWAITDQSVYSAVFDLGLIADQLDQ